MIARGDHNASLSSVLFGRGIFHSFVHPPSGSRLFQRWVLFKIWFGRSHHWLLSSSAVALRRRETSWTFPFRTPCGRLESGCEIHLCVSEAPSWRQPNPLVTTAPVVGGDRTDAAAEGFQVPIRLEARRCWIHRVVFRTSVQSPSTTGLGRDDEMHTSRSVPTQAKLRPSLENLTTPAPPDE